MAYQVIAAIRPGLWAVKRIGAKRALKLFVNFEDAYEYGKKIADYMNAELFVHNRNGVVIEKRSGRSKT